MAITGSAVYLSTLLLEKNRWNGKGPSILVSDWIESTGEAGFAGLDLWMNHLRFTSRSEWELIQEKATDSDLELAFISSILPIDDSDKSQKLRDSILEACESFRPNYLRFTLSEDAKASEAEVEAALASIKTWSQDLPRDIQLVLDPGFDKNAIAQLLKARSILAGSKFDLIVHPFLVPSTEFQNLLQEFPTKLSCLGVQAKKEKDWILLEENRAEHTKTIKAIRDHGFKGNWILESTKGIGRTGEDIYDLFDNAEKDLNYLIETLARSAHNG